NIINFITSLFDKRQIRIITSYGLSGPFTGEDGIDQGETISPLLWRIFYDPLLCKIQSNQDLGYTIMVKKPSVIANQKSLILSARSAASAYMDDTVWIATSKEQAQTIIDTSNGFFDINDIVINGDKS